MKLKHYLSKISVQSTFSSTGVAATSKKSNTRLIAKRLFVKSLCCGLSQNLDIVIDATEHLQPYADLAVAVVGGGAKREALQARAQKQGLSNVQFFPYQPKEHLHDSFATADVFIVSLKQGLAGYIVPSKLYGILAAGRP